MPAVIIIIFQLFAYKSVHSTPSSITQDPIRPALHVLQPSLIEKLAPL